MLSARYIALFFVHLTRAREMRSRSGAGHTNREISFQVQETNTHYATERSIAQRQTCMWCIRPGDCDSKIVNPAATRREYAPAAAPTATELRGAPPYSRPDQPPQRARAAARQLPLAALRPCSRLCTSAAYVQRERTSWTK